MSVSIPHSTARPLSTRLGCVVKAFPRHPGRVATLVPSSARLISAIACRDCVGQASAVVELGPNAKGTTVGRLCDMRPELTLPAIERTRASDEVLKQTAEETPKKKATGAIRRRHAVARFPSRSRLGTIRRGGLRHRVWCQSTVDRKAHRPVDR